MDRVIKTHSQNHNHHSHHKDVSIQELPFYVACCETLAVSMNVDGAGAAKRRRVRRLRSWWRHMSIACALAEALHHSSGCPVYDRRRVGVAQHGAVRGQTTATRVREATGMQYSPLTTRASPSPGEGSAAQPGACRGADPRCPSAADGGTARGSGLFLSQFRACGCRAGHRSAQACSSCLCCSSRGSA